jgi:purine nucleosidase
VTSIILDCDPGIDDALAITFAAGHPGLELAGITTVAGNVGLRQTTTNALAVAEFAGAGTVPVTAGSAGPLLRPALDARHVHGETGLGGAVLPKPSREPEPGHAADFIISSLAERPGEITLVATGPLTNIALAVKREPRITEWARAFVIMGGSATRGNVTPAAEYNMWADPEAASIVFGADWTVHMIGLDVTLLARATPEIQQRMSALGELGSQLLLPAITQYTSNTEGAHPAVHDVCAVVYVAQPSLLRMLPAHVDVETTGRHTSGMTVADFAAPDPNAVVGMELDVTGFWELVLDSYARVGTARTLPARLRGHWLGAVVT